MDIISGKDALCENITEDPAHHSSPQNELVDHQSPSQNVDHSSPKNEPISISRNMTRTARRHYSPKQTSGVFCRIFHEGDFMESLLSPCSCSGSVSQQMIDTIKSHFPTSGSCPPQLLGEVVVLLPVRHMWALQVRLVQFMFNLGHCSSRQPLTVTRRYRPVLQWLCQGENSGDDKRNLVRFLVRIILSRKMSHV